jgi:hypothetical protein
LIETTVGPAVPKSHAWNPPDVTKVEHAVPLTVTKPVPFLNGGFVKKPLGMTTTEAVFTVAPSHVANPSNTPVPWATVFPDVLSETWTYRLAAKKVSPFTG